MKRFFLFCTLTLALGAPATQARDTSDDAVLVYNAGVALVGEGKDEQAVERFSRAIGLDNHQRIFYTSRAKALQRLARPREALSDANRAIELDEFNAASFGLRAAINEDLARWTESRKDYDRALALEPEQGAWVNNRGLMEWRAGHWSVALGDFHHALAMREGDGGADDRALGSIRHNLQAAHSALGWPLSPEEISASVLPKAQVLGAQLAPRQGELRFEARCTGFDPRTGILSFEALAFSLPNGRSHSLPSPKRKVAALGKLRLENLIYGPLDAKLLRPNDAVVIVGRDNGQSVTPRVVCLGLRSDEEKKGRGSLSPELDEFQYETEGAPSLNWASVGRPTFVSADKTTVAGTAFIVNSPQGKRLVSAWHLLTDENSAAPDGGGAQFLQNLREVRLAPFNTARNTVAATAIVATKPLTRDGAVFSFLDASRDIAVWEAPGEGPALEIAQAAPKNLNLVWLAAQAVGQKEAKLIALRVMQSDDKTLVMMPPADFSFQAMSGAPLLNRRGEVVGVFLGSAESLLIAAPLEALRAHVLNPNR